MNLNASLITGGAGFIGANLANHHLSNGRNVIILDDLSRPGSEQNLQWLQERHGSRLTFIHADVRRYDDRLRRAVEDVDVVFHLAAQVAVTTSVTSPRHDFEVNALGTFNVLEAVRNSQSQPIVVYSSTNKVYGNMQAERIVARDGRYAYEARTGISEAQPLDFYSPYGCSKGTGDQYVRDYARIYGLRTVVFRQSCIYGPRQFGVEDQGWVAWFAIRAMQGKPVTIYGDGKQVRDLLYIDDLIQAYNDAVTHIDQIRGNCYNIGGGPANTLSLLELVDRLDRQFGLPLTYSFEKWRAGDQLVFVSDIQKAYNDFGWTPKVGVANGLEKLVEWLGHKHWVITEEAQCASSLR